MTGGPLVAIAAVVVEILGAHFTLESVPGDTVRGLWTVTESGARKSDSRRDCTYELFIVGALLHAEE
jgi:hypothetical protein